MKKGGKMKKCLLGITLILLLMLTIGCKKMIKVLQVNGNLMNQIMNTIIYLIKTRHAHMK